MTSTRVGKRTPNRLPGAAAPMAAFARGEGMTLADVHETLTKETPSATT